MIFFRLSICQEDWLEIYNLYRDGKEKLIGRYCGMTAPGPLDSNRGAVGVRVILHSDQEGVFSGFKARYTFEVAKSIFGGKLSSYWYKYMKVYVGVILLASSQPVLVQ